MKQAMKMKKNRKKANRRRHQNLKMIGKQAEIEIKKVVIVVAVIMAIQVDIVLELEKNTKNTKAPHVISIKKNHRRLRNLKNTEEEVHHNY
jgi:hypothetical protein